MFTMLSQMNVKVPLSEIFRIKEHKSKAIEWISGVGKHIDAIPRKIINENFKPMPKIKEPEGTIS